MRALSWQIAMCYPCVQCAWCGWTRRCSAAARERRSAVGSAWRSWRRCGGWLVGWLAVTEWCCKCVDSGRSVGNVTVLICTVRHAERRCELAVSAAVGGWRSRESGRSESVWPAWLCCPASIDGSRSQPRQWSRTLRSRMTSTPSPRDRGTHQRDEKWKNEISEKKPKTKPNKKVIDVSSDGF